MPNSLLIFNDCNCFICTNYSYSHYKKTYLFDKVNDRFLHTALYSQLTQDVTTDLKAIRKLDESYAHEMEFAENKCVY